MYRFSKRKEPKLAVWPSWVISYIEKIGNLMRPVHFFILLLVAFTGVCSYEVLKNNEYWVIAPGIVGIIALLIIAVRVGEKDPQW